MFAVTMSFASSAALAIAKMAGIVPVMAPGLTDSLADLDALAASARMVFCGKVTPDRALLYSSRGVPVLRQEPGQLTDAYLVLRDLELSESAVVPCGETLGDLADRSSAVAIDLKKKFCNFSGTVQFGAWGPEDAAFGDDFRRAFPDVPCTRIGAVLAPQPGGLVVCGTAPGAARELPRGGFDHFVSASPA